MSILNVVIPIRVSADREDLFDRLSYFKLDTKIPDGVVFTVVDDGSPYHFADMIKEKCQELQIGYLRIDSEDKVFSVGRSRNFAAMSVDSKFIVFQDVDLLPYPGYYTDLLNECYVQKLDQYADRFVMVGVVYLTKEASEEYFKVPESRRKQQFLQYYLENDKTKIEKFSTGTSVVVWRTDHFLCTGGNDPDFEGWGFEDLEYMCRAIRRNRVFPFPSEFSLDYKNFASIQEYKGWKSIYRLYGDMTFNKGIVLFHRWHPVNHDGSYQKNKKQNKVIFEEKLKRFAKDNIETDFLPKIKQGKSLLFRTNPWVLNRWTGPNLGEVVIVDEDLFEATTLLEFIGENEIDRVVFHNPYAGPKMLEFYRAVREAGIPFLVCERGALRDSVFIDPNGFNFDSSSYHPDKWDKPLSDENREKVLNYIIEERATDTSLEEQPDYLTTTELRKKLKINRGRKVLFVPLQRPSDTVIEHFCGPIGTYDNFMSLVKQLAFALPSDWDVVVKRHPLEVETDLMPGVIISHDENIKSLIELADAVLLINSGVGVLSFLYNKKVLVAGNAFYGHDGLVAKVSNVSHVLDAIKNFEPDRDKTYRFLSYLVNDFYSFGKFTTRIVNWKNGAKMSATSAIDFYCVRFPGEEEMCLERSLTPRINASSALFDRYRQPSGDLRLGTPTKAPAAQAAVVKAPPPPGKSTQVKPVGTPVDKDSAKATQVVPNVVLATENTSVALVRNESALTEIDGEFTEKVHAPARGKWAKFKRDPGLFFRDSKHPICKAIGKIL